MKWLIHLKQPYFILLLPFIGIFFLTACPSKANKKITNMEQEINNSTLETATFGGGCFWCTEALFQQIKGVITIESGYSGGNIPNPTYKMVCTGTTGHAEVVQVTFNPQVIAYTELLELFWKTHDPTTLNRQGADVGTQYRSVIFYHSMQQKQLAEAEKKRLNESGYFQEAIVTQIVPFETFYKAEDYHQDYYKNNRSQPYCSMVIEPKLHKLKTGFGNKLNVFE